MDSMRQVADAGDRLAPRARRGLANLARIRGDFPTALATVPTLGWKGRQHRVLGHIRWPHGDIDRAVAAFEAARTEADQHDAPCERAITQTHIAGQPRRRSAGQRGVIPPGHPAPLSVCERLTYLAARSAPTPNSPRDHTPRVPLLRDETNLIQTLLGLNRLQPLSAGVTRALAPALHLPHPVPGFGPKTEALIRDLARDEVGE